MLKSVWLSYLPYAEHKMLAHLKIQQWHVFMDEVITEQSLMCMCTVYGCILQLSLNSSLCVQLISPSYYIPSYNLESIDVYVLNKSIRVYRVAPQLKEIELTGNTTNSIKRCSKKHVNIYWLNLPDSSPRHSVKTLYLSGRGSLIKGFSSCHPYWTIWNTIRHI